MQQTKSTAEIETKWQQKWKTAKLFQPPLDSTKEKYVLTVPYPYGNSALHIGHGRTFTAADILARFERLRGKNVLYPMAFHISGTPVLAVADAIARGDTNQINLTRQAIAEYVTDKAEQDTLLQSFSDPFAIADFFSSKIEETFDSVGLGIDWSRQFTTGEKIYQKFISWQYKKLDETGILIQGKYPILFSPADNNAVGEDDIKDGDIDKVSIQEMTYIKFEIVSTDAPNPEYLVAATLRPDSLFGATNLYVKPEMELAKVDVGELGVWIVSKASIPKIQNQFDNTKVLSYHKGSEFLEKQVIVPLINKHVPVYPMDYPDENHGTGIVYSSPADSPHDYIYLFELTFPNKSLAEYSEDPLKLTPITKTVTKKGEEIKYKSGIPAFDKLHKYQIFTVANNAEKLELAKEELYKEAHYGAVMINCGEFDNTPLKNNVGSQAVAKKLIEQNMGGLLFETSRRAYTRSGDIVIVGNLHGQWFLDYSADAVKEKAYNLLDSMEYYPKQLKSSQRGYLSWVQKRPCARKRGLGTPLPQDPNWMIEPLSDSTIYQMFYIIAHHLRSIDPETLTDAVFEYAYLGKSDVAKIAQETTIPQNILEQMRAEVEYWKAFDLRYTNAPHMSNHLSFLIYHYALIFPEELQPHKIMIAGLLIKDGHKISKSKGNGIPLMQVKQKYGSDLYRLYVATAASYDVEMDFREDEILQLQKKYGKWQEFMLNAKEVFNTNSAFSELKKYHCSQQSQYDSIEYTQILTETIQKITGSLTKTEKGVIFWLLAQISQRFEGFWDSMSESATRDAYVGLFYELVNDIAYAQRRIGETLVSQTLAICYKELILGMTPVVPHFCEELYFDTFDVFASTSVMDAKQFTTSLNNEIQAKKEELQEHLVQHILGEVPRILERKNIVPTQIDIILASDTKYQLFESLTGVLTQTRDFKSILTQMCTQFPSEKQFITKFVPKTLGSGLHAYSTTEIEHTYLESAIPFFEAEFNCKVTIRQATADEQTNALPGKPGMKIT